MTSSYSTTWFAIKYLLVPGKGVKLPDIDIELNDNTYLSVMNQNGAIESKADPTVGGVVLTISQISRFIKKYIKFNILATDLYKANKSKTWFLFKLEGQNKYVLACSDSPTLSDNIDHINDPFVVFSNSTNFHHALTNGTNVFKDPNMVGGRRKPGGKKSMKKRSNKKNKTKYRRRKFMIY